MTIKKFIEKLVEISKENGENLQVKMADYIPVVSPVCSTEINGKKVVIITDQIK